MSETRTAFFLSDRTGITAEMLGHSLLTQFETVRSQEVTLPFIDSVEKARDIIRLIDQRAAADGARPLVISTLVNTEIAQVVSTANALFLDCFEILISPLEKELGVRASHTVGRSGIQIGGIGALAPERRSDLARLGLRALLAGTFANFMTACIAGALL